LQGNEGLIEEGQEIIHEDTEAHIGDLALIGAAQKVEHYEIFGYGTVRTFAQAMGQREAAQLLDQTLKEEEATDKKLTQIAKSLYKEAQRAERSGGGGAQSSSGRGNSSARRGRHPSPADGGDGRSRET
jgi:ferritin-like metal-binding protein YciE